MPPVEQAQPEKNSLPQQQGSQQKPDTIQPELQKGQAPKSGREQSPEDEKQNQRYFNVEKRKDQQEKEQESEGAKGGSPKKPYRQMEGSAQPEEESGKQNQGQGKTKGKELSKKEEEDNPEKAMGRDLKDAQNSAAKGKIKATAQAAKKLMKDIMTMVAHAVSGEAMVQSWYNLIDSFGLTLLYMDFHFVAKYISSSKYFCRFGHEWSKAFSTGGFEKNMQKATTPQQGAGEAIEGAEDTVEQITYMLLEIVEIGGVILLNLLLLLLVTIAMIVILTPILFIPAVIIILFKTPF